MSKKKNALPSGWRLLPLGEVIALEYGKGFPQSKRQPGPYAVYGSNGVIDRADKYLLEEPTIIVGRKGSAGEINLAEPKSWPIDTTYYVQLCNRQVGTLEFAYYLLRWFDPRRFIETTTKPGLNRDRVYEQVVPVPPLPVQERIVEILTKADDIRRKRRIACDLLDAILPSIFHHMFGDPTANPCGYLKTSLGKITSLVTSGYTPRGGARNYVEAGPLLLRSQNVRMLELSLDDCAHLPKSIFDEMSRVRVQPGDVLLNITGASIGRVAFAPEDIPPAVVNQHVCIIRPVPSKVTTEYLAYLLATPWYQHIILNAPGSAQSGFNHARVRALEVLLPPIPVQQAFVEQVRALREARSRYLKAAAIAEDSFRALMARAFTGELTAEWEAANAQQIAATQRLYEALPRLALLALLAEAARRNRSALLLTALMKYVFLLQMESNGRRRFYHFVPYHYGPFAKELYADLEQLRQEGLITIDQDAEEEKTRIAVADPARVQQALRELPEDLRADIAAILDQYGELEHNRLLKTVYEKYPAYAKKSRLLKGARKPPKRSGRSS